MKQYLNIWAMAFVDCPQNSKFRKQNTSGQEPHHPCPGASVHIFFVALWALVLSLFLVSCSKQIILSSKIGSCFTPLCISTTQNNDWRIRRILFLFFFLIGIQLFYNVLVSTVQQSGVPCAIQQVLISYLFYTYQCIYVNPNLPIHHTRPFPPLVS